jgi:hypothetical protein
MSLVMLKNCEIWYAKLNPERPDDTFDKDNPKWNIQIRTTSKETKKEWEALGIKVKAVVPDEGAHYFSANLQRSLYKKDGNKNKPVKVIDGNLEPVDARSIGHGSIGHIRVFQYASKSPKAKEGQMVSMLEAIQLIKHVVYKPKEGEGLPFEKTTTERIAKDDDGSFDSDVGDDFDDSEIVPSSEKKFDKFDDDIPF